MLNQFKRMWNGDDGKNDRDFTGQETKLKIALTHLKEAADNLSRASTVLIDVINGNR